MGWWKDGNTVSLVMKFRCVFRNNELETNEKYNRHNGRMLECTQAGWLCPPPKGLAVSFVGWIVLRSCGDS